MRAADYTVFFVYLGGVLALGLLCRRRDRSDSEFFLAGRSMSWLPVGLSVMVTMFTAVNYTAFPTEVIGHGLYVLILLPVFVLAAIPVTRVFIPFYRGLELTSAYEYLERRFDNRVRRLAGALFILWRLLWMATALYGAGRVLGIVTGLEPRVLILLAGFTAVLYTAAGGMRAVIWTDVAQFAVLIAGISAGLALAARLTPGGAAGILTHAAQHGLLRPIRPFDAHVFSLDPTVRISFCSGVAGGFVAFLARYVADQMTVQRYVAARSLRDAQRGFWLNTGAAVLALLLLAGLGLAAHAYDAARAPTGAGRTDPMRLFASLVLALPRGATGLIAAGLLAATMSSIDSGIHACTAVCVVDFRAPLARRPPLEQDGRKPSRAPARTEPAPAEKLRIVLTAGFGLASVGLALHVGRLGSLFAIVNKVVNGMGSPLLALFLVGMFSRRANSKGVFAGGIAGSALAVLTCFGLDAMALHYYALVNLGSTVIACYLFSGFAEACGRGNTPAQLRWRFRAGRARRAP
ncbi:MAG: sodium/solute symporter [Kiritimatiellae bacterium]|nr:sodium/solute symporter [Kiritimatiellia bacterium]